MRILMVSVALVFLAGCGLFPPGTPDHVHATIAGDTVTIHWSSVDGADSYTVCDRMDGEVSTGGQCLILLAAEDLHATSFSYSLGSSGGGLTTYTYRVRARNSVGTSNWSSYSNAIVH